MSKNTKRIIDLENVAILATQHLLNTSLMDNIDTEGEAIKKTLMESIEEDLLETDVSSIENSIATEFIREFLDEIEN